MPSAAFCPYPPLLVHGVTGGRVPEVEGLREACRDAVRVLAGSARVTVVGPALTPTVQRFPADARGTLAGLGVDPAANGGRELPLSLTVGRWLLDDACAAAPAGLVAVPADLSPAQCLSLGELLAQDDLLVLADGSSRRGPKPPGGPHPAAGEVDGRLAVALATGDVDALARLDVAMAEQVGATGRAAWQVLAGWAGRRPVTSSPLRYDDAPFGVGYLVGAWSVSVSLSGSVPAPVSASVVPGH